MKKLFILASLFIFTGNLHAAENAQKQIETLKKENKELIYLRDKAHSDLLSLKKKNPRSPRDEAAMYSLKDDSTRFQSDISENEAKIYALETGDTKALLEVELNKINLEMDDLAQYKDDLSSADLRRMNELKERKKEIQQKLEVNSVVVNEAKPSASNELQAACDRYLKQMGLDFKGDFLIQTSQAGGKIRLFTDKGFSEFESDRQTCTFYDKSKPEVKKYRKGKQKDSFEYSEAFNKASILAAAFKDAMVPGVKFKNMIPGRTCVKFYLEGEKKAAYNEQEPSMSEMQRAGSAE